MTARLSRAVLFARRSGVLRFAGGRGLKPFAPANHHFRDGSPLQFRHAVTIDPAPDADLRREYRHLSERPFVTNL
jgi:hypothetical protein